MDNIGGTQAAGTSRGGDARPSLPSDRLSLRVAGVDPERGFGGGETQVLGLSLELDRAGHRAEVVCDPDGELWRRAQAAGLVCRPLKIRNSIDVAAGFRLRNLITRRRYDVVHFHTSRAHALAPYTQGLDITRVVTRRMDYPPNRIFGPYLYNRAVEGVIAISEGVAEALAESAVARQNLHVISSGVDCADFSPPTNAERAEARARLGLDRADIAVGAVGALTARKGHRYMIDALAIARRTTASPLRGFIAGDGDLASELAAHAREADAESPVLMLGQLADPRNLLRALDIFVMPSLKEGLGVAALEAMACGIPVIASDVGGLREVVEESVSGRLIAPENVRALAEAVADLAREPSARASMGAAARQRAIDKFGMAAMAARTVDFYMALRAKRGVSHERRTD